jgi:hypothetical protein
MPKEAKAGIAIIIVVSIFSKKNLALETNNLSISGKSNTKRQGKNLVILCYLRNPETCSF